VRRSRFALGVVIAAILTLGACEQPRKEKDWERVTRLRLQYRVSPNWYEVKTFADGHRELAMDLTVTNDGKEGLTQVTMVLRVLDFQEKERLAQPLTLDTSKLKPGKPDRLVVSVPGVEVREGESVALRMEGQPAIESMRHYPEYKGTIN